MSKAAEIARTILTLRTINKCTFCRILRREVKQTETHFITLHDISKEQILESEVIFLSTIAPDNT